MRIRTIKPDFWESESIGRVSREARLLFIGLFSCCDDYGKTRANSRLLASRLFPYDEDSLSRLDGWLKELESEGCVRLYCVGGDTFLDIPKWLTHQKIDKPSKSKLPDFVEGSRHFSEPSRKIALEQGTGNREQGTGSMSGNPEVSSLPEDEAGSPNPTVTLPNLEASQSAKPTPQSLLLSEPSETKTPTKENRFEDAIPILQLLNELTGSSFREVESNLKLIDARLSEKGVDAEGMAMMVRRQVAKWKPDPKMAEYLRPQTLFGKEKFESYYASREMPVSGQKPAQQTQTSWQRRGALESELKTLREELDLHPAYFSSKRFKDPDIVTDEHRASLKVLLEKIKSLEREIAQTYQQP